MKNYRSFINFTLVIILLIFPVSLSQSKTIPNSFADLAEKLMPSVVNISTTQTIKTTSNPFPFQFPPGSPFEDMFKEFNKPTERKATALGSGFIINKKGLIVTNNHVIQGAEDIVVTFNDKTEYKAKVIGKDPEFFAFYRAMQAYENALIGGDTSLILSPDSDFFKFFIRFYF